MNNPPPKLADHRLLLTQKLLFCIGVNLDHVSVTMLTSVMWIPFFNLGHGINPAKLGFIPMFIRSLDILSNPILAGLCSLPLLTWLSARHGEADHGDGDAADLHRRPSAQLGVPEPEASVSHAAARGARIVRHRGDRAVLARHEKGTWRITTS